MAFGAAWAYRHWPSVDGRAAHRGEADVDADGAEDECHVVKRRIDGTFECRICRKVARTPAGGRRLLREACGGDILHRIDESHVIRYSCGVTWCDLCGAYTTRWPRRLLRECDRRPRTAAHRTILKRLRAGLPPMDSPHFQVAAKEDEDGSRRVDAVTTPIVGRYRRLPAERDADGERTNGQSISRAFPGLAAHRGSTQSSTPTRGTPPPPGPTPATSSTRRRIRGKSSPPAAPAMECIRPAAAPSWTRWIVAASRAEHVACGTVSVRQPDQKQMQELPPSRVPQVRPRRQAVQSERHCHRSHTAHGPAVALSRPRSQPRAADAHQRFCSRLEHDDDD